MSDLLEDQKIHYMDRLAILDFNTGNVDIYLVATEYEPDMDELLSKLGHRANDCQWMFFQGEVTFHKEVLK